MADVLLTLSSWEAAFFRVDVAFSFWAGGGLYFFVIFNFFIFFPLFSVRRLSCLSGRMFAMFQIGGLAFFSGLFAGYFVRCSVCVSFLFFSGSSHLDSVLVYFFCFCFTFPFLSFFPVFSLSSIFLAAFSCHIFSCLSIHLSVCSLCRFVVLCC